MSITGNFDADFSNFYTACRQAEVELRKFETESGKVERQLNSMADAFSGRRVIADAQLMAEAIGRLGGPARLTEAELRRAGNAAAEAAEKMTRLGLDPPIKMQLLAKHANLAGDSVRSMGSQVRQVDNILQVFGVDVGQEARALEDAEYAMSRTVKELGLLGAATATAGIAMGAWKIGEKIGEINGLTEKIRDATAALLGYANAQDQRAAAKADVLAKATATAGRAITDFNEALVINQVEAERVIAANQKMSDKFVETSEKARVSAARMAEVWENNRVKLNQLHHDFAIAEQERRAKEQVAEEGRLKAVGEQIDADTRSAQSAKDMRDAYLEAQIKTRQETQRATLALEEQADAARKAAAAITVTRTYSNLDTDEGIAEFKRLNPGATLSVGKEYFKNHTLEDAVRSGVLNWYGNWANAGVGGMMGMGMVSPIQSTIPTQTRNDLQVPVNVNVTGVLDSRTIDELAVKVGAAIVKGAGAKARVF